MTYYGNLIDVFILFIRTNLLLYNISTLKDQKAILITVKLSNENKSMPRLSPKSRYTTSVENLKVRLMTRQKKNTLAFGIPIRV